MMRLMLLIVATISGSQGYVYTKQWPRSFIRDIDIPILEDSADALLIAKMLRGPFKVRCPACNLIIDMCKEFITCHYGVYRNEECNNSLDCYAGHDEYCTKPDVSSDNIGKKCTQGYTCNSYGRCDGIPPKNRNNITRVDSIAEIVNDYQRKIKDLANILLIEP